MPLRPARSSRAHKIYELDVREAAAKLPLFANERIKRRLTAEQVRFFLDALAAQGNVEWKDKAKATCLVYFKTPAQWGRAIYDWALSLGKLNTVCTVFEIREGEDAEDQVRKARRSASLLRVATLLSLLRFASLSLVRFASSSLTTPRRNSTKLTPTRS